MLTLVIEWKCVCVCDGGVPDIHLLHLVLLSTYGRRSWFQDWLNPGLAAGLNIFFLHDFGSACKIILVNWIREMGRGSFPCSCGHFNFIDVFHYINMIMMNRNWAFILQGINKVLCVFVCERERESESESCCKVGNMSKNWTKYW